MAWFDDLNLPGAEIVGHFGLVYADSNDEDIDPDLLLASGTVVLTPTTPAVLIDGAWVGIRPVTATVFEGELVVSEEDPSPIRILATDAVEGVEDWAWTATFSIAGFPLDPVTFKAPADETVVLTGTAPSINSVPYRVIQGASIDTSEQDLAEGLIRFKLTNGEHTPWMPGVGERGPRGPRGYSGADAAPASLTIGQVAQGAAPQAWITGTPPNQVLSLTLPRGARGHTPVMSWNGTRLVVDGASGPDLRGPTMQINEPSPGAIEAGGVEVHGFTPDGDAATGAADGVRNVIAANAWQPVDSASTGAYFPIAGEFLVRPDGEVLLRGAIYRSGGWSTGSYTLIRLPGVTFKDNAATSGLNANGQAYRLESVGGDNLIGLRTAGAAITTDIYLDCFRAWTDPIGGA